MSELEISGYAPGLVGWTVELHGRYYAKAVGFGPIFEARVAREMGAFLPRDGQPGCKIWRAHKDGKTLGSLTLDGADDETRDGLAHLRWFIVSEDARSLGVGQALMNTAIAFARSEGLNGIYLTTIDDMKAARAVYLKSGFKMVSEEKAETWGKTSLEQRYELRF